MKTQNSSSWDGLTNLIIVPGHAVYTAPHFNTPAADSSWFLMPFQYGEPTFYIEHISEGVRQVAKDPNALLIFSGGQTRASAGPKSEGLSYWNIAQHYDWWHHREVDQRVSTEEYATDSFENLLFSIARFKECTGSYPNKVTVVNWAFKKERFRINNGSIKFPVENFTYIGINQPIQLDPAISGEEKTIAQFKVDPYGASAKSISKRSERNPFKRQHSYRLSCPELNELFIHKGPELFNGSLPWD